MNQKKSPMFIGIFSVLLLLSSVFIIVLGFHLENIFIIAIGILGVIASLFIMAMQFIITKRKRDLE